MHGGSQATESGEHQHRTKVRTVGSGFGIRPSDARALAERGLEDEDALLQLRRLRRGSRFLNLDRPAVVGDGIEVLAPEFADARNASFKRALPRTTRFIPASGAASRMFGELLARLDAGSPACSAAAEQRPFFAQDWPFRSLIERVENRGGLDARLRALLLGSGSSEPGLAQRPKALIPFHRDQGGIERTALEEQIAEAVELALHGESERACLHFTVSEAHRTAIEQVAAEFAASVPLHLEVGTSVQHPATDTLALDEHDRPLRRSDALVFRPGGHGALLRNLDELGAEFVLIKNIDNVQPASRRAPALHWRKALLGALGLARDDVFSISEDLERASPSTATIDAACALLRRFGRVAESTDPRTLHAELDRPLRLCGVVPNLGEPGGGPFWVRGQQGRLSLQIVESAQIDPDRPDQQARRRQATHFNPVDLACSVRNRHGDAYRLTDYRDDDSYFVAHKTEDGRPIRALELPGLWNGAMSGWLTLFVEAPIETFTPVKTVWDLLRKEHRSADAC